MGQPISCCPNGDVWEPTDVVWSGVSAACVTYLATSHVIVSTNRVDITSPTGQVLKSFQADSGSSVTEDETATVRRVATINLSSTGSDGLVPENPGDLLHPLSGNELRPYNGIVVPGGTTEWVPMGVFAVSDPQVSELSGGGMSLTLNVSDRSSIISRAKWTGAWTGGSGLTVDAAIMAGLNLKWPGTSRGYPLQFNFTPTDVVIAANTILGIQYTTTGTSPAQQGGASQNDPFADFQAWALEAGFEVLFDRLGIATLRVPPGGADTPISVVYESGDLNRATAYGRTLDGDAFANSFTVIGTGARTPTIQSVGSVFTLTNTTDADITGTITVPSTATQAKITVAGAQGATASGAPAGKGGTIQVVCPVTPGNVFTYVAGAPAGVSDPAPGGIPGGSGDGTAAPGDNSYVATPDGTRLAHGNGGGAGQTIDLLIGTTTIGVDGSAYTQDSEATIVTSGVSTIRGGFVSITWQANVLVPGPVVRATAEDNNPWSPGYIGGPQGVVPADVIVSTSISTEPQAAAAAATALITGEAVADETNATATPNPTLDVGDACSINRPVLKIGASYIMSAITTPIGLTDTTQTVTNRAASIQVFTGTPYVTVYQQTDPTPAYYYGRGGAVFPVKT
jgi:Domain of unknown function (DUF5047)